MGEHRPVKIVRAIGVATLVVAAVTALSSCSAEGTTPGAATSSPSGEVLDPTVSSPVPTEPIASDTPAPTVAPVASSAPSAPSAPSSDSPTSSTDSRKAVVPFITTADWDPAAAALDVSAIVPGVIESGGTCTVTLTSGSTVRTATSDGVAASSYTGCEAVAVKDLAAGSWQVRVRYSSPKSAGASALRTVQVG